MEVLCKLQGSVACEISDDVSGSEVVSQLRAIDVGETYEVYSILARRTPADEVFYLIKKKLFSDEIRYYWQSAKHFDILNGTTNRKWAFLYKNHPNLVWVLLPHPYENVEVFLNDVIESNYFPDGGSSAF